MQAVPLLRTSPANSLAVVSQTLGKLSAPQPHLPSQAAHAHKPEVPSPVNVNRLAFWLSGYVPNLRSYLLEGFTWGFHLGHEGFAQSSHGRNLPSADQYPQVLQEKICRELALGRVAGPFPSPPFANVVISPIGLVPKRAPGKFRMIHHLSYPHGSSVNDGIPLDRSS